jgi:hypothetical protein
MIIFYAAITHTQLTHSDILRWIGLVKTALKICKVIHFSHPNRDVRVLMG